MKNRISVIALGILIFSLFSSFTYADVSKSSINTTSTSTTSKVATTTATTTPSLIARDLFFGSRGDDVKVLQAFLAKDPTIYPLGLVTGYFGPVTRVAVKKYQIVNKIVATGTESTTGFGRVGPTTRTLLNKNISSNFNLFTKANGITVNNSTTTATATATTTTTASTTSAVAGGGGGGGGGLSQILSQGNSTNQIISISQSITPPDPTYPMPPHGQEVIYSVSTNSAEAVKFTTVDINPLVVYPGDTQTLKVVISSVNPVSSVTATTQIDHSTLVLNLTNDGTGTNTWTTSWVVNDTHVNLYKTLFTATDNVGNTGSTNMAWSDPCTGFTDGADSTLGANCTLSVVDGVDGGNLNIPSGKTITLNAGANLVFNSGKTITITKGGSITKASGATIQKGYLYYVDADNDGYTPSKTTKYYNSSATASGYVRASIGGPRPIDPLDNNASITQTVTCYVDADGDGWTVGSPGSVNSANASCPAGYSATSLGADCNDANAALTNNCYSYAYAQGYYYAYTQGYYQAYYYAYTQGYYQAYYYAYAYAQGYYYAYAQGYYYTQGYYYSYGEGTYQTCASITCAFDPTCPGTNTCENGQCSVGSPCPF